jgi:hypothetical protein
MDGPHSRPSCYFVHAHSNQRAQAMLPDLQGSGGNLLMQAESPALHGLGGSLLIVFAVLGAVSGFICDGVVKF